MLHAQDLAELPQSKRQPYAADIDFLTAAESLNEAFEWFALWALGQHQRASHSEVRDWFNQVATQAANLSHALGHDKPPLAKPGFQDVLTHLLDAKPHPGREAPDKELHAQHRMESLARRAMPDAYAQAEREGASDSGWEIANQAIGAQLKASLELLNLLAARGAAHQAPLVTKGGSDPEEARKHLFVSLAEQYRRLFGKLPAAPSPITTKTEKAAGERRTTRPKGPALTWFQALLDLLGARAMAALPHAQPSGAAPDPEREAVLRELVGLSMAAAKGKAADGLSHWIREASAICAKHPRSASSSSTEPVLGSSHT